MDKYGNEIYLFILFFLCIAGTIIELCLNNKNNRRICLALDDQMKKLLYALPQTSMIVDDQYIIQEIINIQRGIYKNMDTVLLSGKSFSELQRQYPEMEVLYQSVRKTRQTHSSQMLSYKIKDVFDKEITMQVSTIMLNDNYIVCLLQEISRESDSLQEELSVAFKAGVSSAWKYDVDNQKFSSIYNDAICGTFTDDGCQSVKSDGKDVFLSSLKQLTNGVDVKCNFKYRRGQPDGSFNWYKVCAMALPDMYGHVGRIVGSESDITSHVLYEDRLRRERERIRILLHASGFTSWDYDMRKDRMFASNYFSDLSEGHSLQVVKDLVYPDDVHKLDELQERVINGAGMHSFELLRIRSIKDKDEYRWHEIFAIMAERGELNDDGLMIGIVRDVTDRIKSEEKLKEQKKKSEESNRLKSAFLANMSHEIRTPLNAIVGFSALIADSSDINERKNYLKIVQKNNEMLLQLINDILDISKIEAGQLQFVYEDFSLNQLYKELEQIHSFHMKPEISFFIKIPSKDYIIRSDRKRVTQVLSNFITNAIKYTNEGSIEIGFYADNDVLKCYVKDTGKGIPEDKHSLVFGRFNKFDPKVPGNGLGLSICENIIGNLKGKIGFESEEAKGSMFWFTFPLSVITKVKQGESRLPVLVVTADDNLYMLVSCILKRKNYKCLRANDNDDVLKMATDETQSSFVIDIKSRKEIDEIVKLHEAYSTVPIIGLVEFEYDNLTQLAEQNGCDETMCKPVKAQELLDLADKYMAR